MIVDSSALIAIAFEKPEAERFQTHMQEAQEAWRRHGKGRHPAALDPGYCCAYAVSRIEGRPLLFQGDAFAKTDVEKADW